MNAAADRSQLVRFGNFEADLRAHELRKDGERVRLQVQPFLVLALLLERAGNVVTRDELRQKLWPSSVYVDFDHGLNNAIARLREAVGDEAGTPRYIETLPRIGYRFIYPITDREQSTAAPVERQRSRRLGTSLAALAIVAAALLAAWLVYRAREPARAPVIPGEASIAVLPFVSMSADAENDYFADGLTEELTQKLAGIRGLKVAGRTSAFYFKGRSEPTAAIAKALHVNHLLEGSVRRSGERIRITAQLIDARDGYHLWSQTFDRNLTDIFQIQEDIALAVASALEIKLASDEAMRLRRRGTDDAEAYRLYVIAMAYLRGITVARDLEYAKSLLEKALARDPRFAAAHAAIAQYHFKRALPALADIERDAQLGLAAAERAITLDPDSSEALDADANFQWWLYDNRGDFAAFVRAQSSFRRAVEFDPSNSLAFFDYGRSMLWYDADLSKSLHERTIEIDPFAIGSHMFTVSILGMRGQLEAARSHCRSPVVLSLIDKEACALVLGSVEAYFGNLEQSIILLRAVKRRTADTMLWSAYLSLGDRAAARRELNFGAAEPAKALAAAAALAMEGRHIEAFRSLERQRPRFEFSRILDVPTARFALIAGEPGQALAILKARLPDVVTGTEPVNARNVLPALDLAAAWLATGERTSARQLLVRIATFLEGSSVPRLPLFEFARARMHALDGDRESALQALERAYQAGFRTTWAVDLHPRPLLYIDPIEVDPCLASLRTDPRFARWLARIATDNARQLERLRARDASPAST